MTHPSTHQEPLEGDKNNLGYKVWRIGDIETPRKGDLVIQTGSNLPYDKGNSTEARNIKYSKEQHSLLPFVKCAKLRLGASSEPGRSFVRGQSPLLREPEDCVLWFFVNPADCRSNLLKIGASCNQPSNLNQ